MPFKDHEKRKAYQREWAAAKRAKNAANAIQRPRKEEGLSAGVGSGQTCEESRTVSNRCPQISGGKSRNHPRKRPRTKSAAEGRRTLMRLTARVPASSAARRGH